MDNSTQRTNQSSQVDFLKAVIDSAEKRRDAVENKASILIAANAILCYSDCRLHSTSSHGECKWLINCFLDQYWANLLCTCSDNSVNSVSHKYFGIHFN